MSSSDDSSNSSPSAPSPPDSSKSENSSPKSQNSSTPPPPPPNNNSQSPPSKSENNSSNSPSPPSNDNNSNSNKNNNNKNSGDNSGGGGGGGNNNNGGGGGNKSPSPPPPPAKSGSGSHSPSTPAVASSSRGGASANSNAPALKNSSSSSSSSSSKDDGMMKIIIAGGAVGVGVLILILLIICVVCARKKKKRRQAMSYYNAGPGNMNMNNNYYNNGGNWQQHVPQKDHMVNMPPMGPPVSSEHGGWGMHAPPPPPAAMANSGDMSTAGFGGGPPPPPPHPAMAANLGYSQSSYSYEELAAATNNFAQSNLLGQGGFGFVHKGVLQNGKEVAVKSLKANSGQGEREFQAEIDVISRVHHRHLVSLHGYCITGSKRLLVYEFVNNGTLEYHLHGSNAPTMDWPTRLKIALGSAKGFAYIHEDCHPRIIHRDIKAANILLDTNYDAKVADFGLAKLSEDNHTHVSTRIMGTFGYLAPEYASSGKLTEKSDIYSFGIMLLELVTGRRPIDISSDDDTLVDWARPLLIKYMEGGGYEELVDPNLGKNYNPDEMNRMVACAAACIRHSARRRPKMSQIVRALEGAASLDDLNQGVKGTGHAGLIGSGSDVDLKHKHGLTSSQEFSEDGHTGEFVHEK